MPVVPNPSIAEMLAALADRLEAVEARLAALQSHAAETRQLAATSATPMPDGAMLVQTLHGLKFLIDPMDRAMGPQMIVYKQWEPEVSSFLKALVKPTSLVVDVGANFGYFSCLAADRIGWGGGRVIALEPNPAMAALLRANAEINWSMAPIEIVEAAAGPSVGSVTLIVPKDHAGNASLSAQTGDPVEVRQVRIDDLVPDGQAVDLMKVDVEGHEFGVLGGARRVVSQSADITLIMEWSLGLMRLGGTEPEAMLALLEALGLQAFRLGPTPDFSDDARLSPEQLLQIGYGNIAFRRR